MSAPAAVSVFPPLKNILYATDFSPCSQAALPYLQAISERYGAAVHVVHAQPQVLTTDRAAKIDSERYAAEVEMRAVVASGAFNNIAFTTTVASGEVWEILSTVIREKNIDAIVMGTHGRRGVDKLVLGSVTEQVIRHASCPVLTLGPEAIHEPVDAGFSRILFATDYSAGSKHALRYALSLAQANHSHLIMLHVMDGKLGAMPSTSEATSPGVQILAEYIAQALAYGRHHLAEQLSADVLQRLNPEILVECGSAAETILATALKRDVRLIVMGARRSLVDSISTHWPWATASLVICGAHCPVLTVRG